MKIYVKTQQILLNKIDRKMSKKNDPHSGKNQSPDPAEGQIEPNVSAESLQTAKLGMFPKENEDLRPTPPMHKSQASLKTETHNKNNTELSSYATASLSKLDLRKSSTKLTNSSDQMGNKIMGHMAQLDKMKHDFGQAKLDVEGEGIKSSRIYEELIKLMREVELFKTQDNLRGSDLDEIIQVMAIEKFKEDDIVFNYGDIGDKFFIILGGEAAVLIPNKEQIYNWDERYEQYKLLLEEMALRKLNERKEQLIAMREFELQGSYDIPPPLQASMSIVTPTFSKNSSFAQTKARPKKFLAAKSVMIKDRRSSKLDFQREAYLENNIESSNSTISRQNSMEGSFGIIKEIDEDSHFELGGINVNPHKKKRIRNESMIDNASRKGYAGDQEYNVNMKAQIIIQDMQSRINNFESVKEHKAEPITTMDKLMKRIKRLDKQSDRINQPMYSGYDLDPKLLKDQLEKDDPDGTDTSMLAALGKKRAKTKELYVQDLTEKQISRLTQRQINQIVRKEVKLTLIDPKDEKEELNREWLIEFKRLKRGEFFGELALIRPDCRRAATIKCTKGSIFGVVKKEDYRRVVGKIQQRAKTKVNNFLQSLPIFRTWSTKHLSQLQLYLEKVEFIRNQVVIKEDSPQKSIYLVINGEFEYTKKVRAELKKDVKIEKLLGPLSFTQEKVNYNELTVVNSALGDLVPQNAARTENSTTGSSLSKPKLQGIFKIANFSEGQFFGEDDYIKHRKHFGTVTCISSKGTLFRMTTKVFENRILNKNEDSKIDTYKQIANKDKIVKERIDMIGSIYNITPEDIRENAKLEDNNEEFKLNKSSSKQILLQSKKQPNPYQNQESSLVKLRDFQDADISIQNQSIKHNLSAVNMNLSAAGDGSTNEGDYQFLPNDSSAPSLRESRDQAQRHSSPHEKSFDSQISSKYNRNNDSITTMGTNKVVPPPTKLEYPPQIKTFRPINKTRKIQYPQLIKKYQVEKPKQMYIDDFRSAMKQIVKQPDDRGFMKMDENISNFSSEGELSQKDPRNESFYDVEVTGSPSMHDMNSSEKHNRLRAVGSSLPSTIKHKTIFPDAARNSFMQPTTKFKQSMINIRQNNFRLSGKGTPTLSPGAQQSSSFYANRSIDYRNKSGPDYTVMLKRQYLRQNVKGQSQKQTSELYQQLMTQIKGPKTVQTTDESVLFNPKTSERSDSQEGFQANEESNGPEIIIRNQQSENPNRRSHSNYDEKYSHANSLQNVPKTYQGIVSGQYPVDLTNSQKSSLLPAVVNKSQFDERKRSMPLAMHNIRQYGSNKKSLLGIDQISKLFLSRNGEDKLGQIKNLSSEKFSNKMSLQSQTQLPKTSKQKNNVTDQILSSKPVRYIGVAHTMQRYKTNENINRQRNNMTQKSRQQLLK